MPAVITESTFAPAAVARAPDSEELVMVFNRSGASYTHYTEDGRKIVIGPNGDGEVPANIAELWRKLSCGTLNVGTPGTATDIHSQLSAERTRTAELEAKIALMEARFAALEQKDAPKGGKK